MERMTLARYFPLSWKRQQPLWGSASTGKFQVRPAGVKEGSHVRANECPYAALHGMSLSAGGFADQRNSDRKAGGLEHWVERLNDILGPHTMLEIVDINAEGSDPENSGLMLRCRCPELAPGLVRFLTQLRLRLLECLGGPEAIDFLVLCMSDQEGSFVVIFAPTPQLMQLQEGHADLVPWANPLTGESSEIAGIEESRLDFGKGVGHFLVLKEELRKQLLDKGEDTLRRIWAFNRVPGSRKVIEDFIVQQNILET
ncbi:unnamed protein product [Durusdinium trenchii]